MSDDARFEQLFVDGLTDLAPSRAPGPLRYDITQATARMRPRPRWLAALKEPPMHASSRLTVGSPTIRAATILAATLLLGILVTGAGLAGTRLLAADGSIVVDQSGAGDFATISEAVAAVTDGDTILVRPGRYEENVLVEGIDLTIRGDGDRRLVVLANGANEPMLTLTNTDSTVSGMTLSGPNSAVVIQGGSPSLTGLIFDHVGQPLDPATVLDGLIINVRATPLIADNEFDGGGWIRAIGSSAPVIERNVLRDGPRIELVDPAEGTVIRGNSITDAHSVAIGVYGFGSILIEDNVIEGGDNEAIAIGELGLYALGTDPVVRNNTISGARCGITVADGAAPLIESNRLSVSEYGLVFAAPSTAQLVDNDIQLGDGAKDIVEGLDVADPEGDGFCQPEESAQ